MNCCVVLWNINLSEPLKWLFHKLYIHFGLNFRTPNGFLPKVCSDSTFELVWKKLNQREFSNWKNNIRRFNRSETMPQFNLNESQVSSRSATWNIKKYDIGKNLTESLWVKKEGYNFEYRIKQFRKYNFLKNKLFLRYTRIS